jgi:hypothetical protein
MSAISYDEVNLMLRFYDMRREARLRQARSWFLDHFHPVSPDEMMEKYAPGTDEYNNIRMVLSYWDMVASIVNRGLINDELFFESNGEIWVVWDRIRSIVPTWRAAFKNPTVFLNLEEACKRLEAWREKRAPGSNVAMRQMMQQVFGVVTDARASGTKRGAVKRDAHAARSQAGARRRRRSPGSMQRAHRLARS